MCISSGTRNNMICKQAWCYILFGSYFLLYSWCGLPYLVTAETTLRLPSVDRTQVFIIQRKYTTSASVQCSRALILGHVIHRATIFVESACVRDMDWTFCYMQSVPTKCRHLILFDIEPQKPAKGIGIKLLSVVQVALSYTFSYCHLFDIGS